MIKYELNEKGGWIIPANTTVTEKVIPAFSIIGSNVTLRRDTEFSPPRLGEEVLKPPKKENEKRKKKNH